MSPARRRTHFHSYFLQECVHSLAFKYLTVPYQKSKEQTQTPIKISCPEVRTQYSMASMPAAPLPLPRAIRLLPNLSWEDFQRSVLMSQDCILYYRNLARAHNLNITGRDLLSAYAFLYYNACGDNSALIQASREWINLLDDQPSEHQSLQEALRTYEVVYIEWKRQDREETLHHLATMYWEYEVAYNLRRDSADLADPSVREYYLAQKREKQQELIKTMEDIDGGEFFRQFTPISVAADFADHVAATLELAFWNRIRDDLQATPPSLNSLLSVIDEMRDIFMVLWTHSQVSRLPHAQSRQEWIMDLLDIEFIKQRGAAAITTGDLSFWRLRCEAMLDALCEVDSPAAEEEHRAWIAAHPITDVNTAMDAFAYTISKLSSLYKIFVQVQISQDHTNI